jgi:hypothetical protein
MEANSNKTTTNNNDTANAPNYIDALNQHELKYIYTPESLQHQQSQSKPIKTNEKTNEMKTQQLTEEKHEKKDKIDRKITNSTTTSNCINFRFNSEHSKQQQSEQSRAVNAYEQKDNRPINITLKQRMCQCVFVLRCVVLKFD